MDANINKLSDTLKEKNILIKYTEQEKCEYIRDISKLYYQVNIGGSYILEAMSRGMPLKMFFLCKKIACTKQEYSERHKIICIFSKLFISFVRKKYKNTYMVNDEPNFFKINYTDVSTEKEGNRYIISYYVVADSCIGVFEDIKELKYLMKELNYHLSKHNRKYFGDNFIDLNLYQIFDILNKTGDNSKSIFFVINVFTYINQQSEVIDVHRENSNKKIYKKNNKYIFKNLVCCKEDTTKLIFLDNRKEKKIYHFFTK